MDIWITLAGALLILIAALDVFGVVLATRAMGGSITPLLNRLIWATCRRIDISLGLQARLMTLVGPALLVIVVAVWVSLFITGFALIYLPMLGTHIHASSGNLHPDLITALYFSGFNFATLGLGDIVPVSDTARVLTVVEACTGFAVFTLGISYTLNIFEAVNQRDTFALSLHGGTGETGRVEIALLGLCPDGQPAEDVGTAFGTIADQTHSLLQTHHAYPIAHYFRRRKLELGMSRIAVQVLDLTTLAEAALERDAYVKLLRSRGFLNAKQAGRRLVQVTRQMMYHTAVATVQSSTAVWASHFNAAYTQLAEHGLQLLPRDTAWNNYRELRAAWNDDAQALAEKLGYDWAAVSGADS